MKIALLTTDNREHHRRYDLPQPYFGPAIEGLVQGLASVPGLEVHVISCTQRPMHAPDKLSPSIWFHLLDVPKTGWLRTGYQGCIRAIRRKLSEIQPDLVHGQGTERECGLAAVFSGYPNVITIHGNMSAVAQAVDAHIGSFAWCAAKLERFILPRTNGVLCNSLYTQRLVQRRNSRTWQVPNALRLLFFETPLPFHSLQATPVILNIGTVTSYKRQVELLLLAEQLHLANHHFEIQFIGGADSRSPYGRLFLERVAEAERKGFARHLGFLSLQELVAKMDTSSALVHAPSEEAFGLVVAEALTRNLKFFGTRVGGLPDIAEGIDGAALFQLGDETSMRDSIAHWLQEGAPLPSAAAEVMRQRYHPEVIARKHVDVYKSVCGSL